MTKVHKSKSGCARYKRAAVSEVSGIRLLDGAPVIEGKVIKEHKLSCRIC